MQTRVSPKIFWAGWLGVATAWEWRSLRKHDGSTFSETTRLVFCTHTVPGKAAFLSGIAALLLWFPRHILLNAVEGSIALLTNNEDEDETNGS